MSDPKDLSLKKHHSFYEPYCKESVYTGIHCKSDANLILSNESVNQEFFIIKDGENTSSENSGCGEYYKRYEYDAIPVKDDVVSCDFTSTESGEGEGIVPLTESHLEKLEKDILSHNSQELPTSTSSSSLDSNARYFKNTVEEIFKKFYASMIDFEQYKMRYKEILSRNKEDSFEMENFIRDMVHHIMSSESSEFDESRLCEAAARGAGVAADPAGRALLRSLHSVVEAFKNENYLTDSTAEEKGCTRPEYRHKSRNDEILSIYLTSVSPCLDHMNNRRLISEINFNDPRLHREPSLQAASAEDIKKVAAKRRALELHERQRSDAGPPRRLDRDIPVKLSFAKKDIHLNQDFDRESNQNDKSFMSRICNYLCKRIRKAV